jgi:anti-anti-sigma factor
MTTTSETGEVPSGCDFPPLDVSVRNGDPSAWVIEVRGELDLATGPILKQHLRPYNDASGNGHARRIIYLLSELQFMDVTGLNALLGAVDRHNPDTITIREPTLPVRRLLELVGMGSMIEKRAKR